MPLTSDWQINFPADIFLISVPETNELSTMNQL